MHDHVDKPKAALKEEKRHDTEAEDAGYQIVPDEDKSTSSKAG
jgi:hypothetical protein